MNEAPGMKGLSRILFGGGIFARSSAADLKRALMVDGIAVLLLLLALAGAALGQSPDPKQQQQEQKQTEQSSAQASADPQQADSVTEAARKAKARKSKEKKVYGEEDLAGLKGGVSVVGNGTAAASGSSRASSVQAGASSGANGKDDEEQWQQRAQQIHTQMAATDEQIKKLKEDIKKTGASGFDPQTGLKDNVIYINDKNARLQ